MYTCNSSRRVHKADSVTATNDIVPPATPNWFIVGLESMNVIQIGLPVLDEPPVVRGDHPHSVVAPGQVANRTVMTLHADKERRLNQLVGIK